MSSVIELSDSEEDGSASTPDADVNPKRDGRGVGHVGADGVNDGYDDYDAATGDSDLPEVPFCARGSFQLSATSRSEKNHRCDSDDDDDDDDDDDEREHARRGVHVMSDSDSEGCDAIAGAASQRRRRQPRKPTTTTSKRGKKNRAETGSREERTRRRQALAREKALKAIAAKRSRNMKPGECMRFMEVVLDHGIDELALGATIKDTLLNANVAFNMTAQSIPNSITWRRNVEEDYVGENDEVCSRTSVQTEEHVIVIWSNGEAARHVAEGTLCASVLNSKALLPNYNVTLVIFGMEEYFAYRKGAKEASKDRRASGRGSKRNDKGNRQFEAFPIVSRQQLETCLTEVQIVAKCSSRLIESAQDLALMVYQYTKSISEIPYKLQKRESVESKFEWYVMGDNRNTVRVDKDGNGLRRLWQQQLCQFNLSSLEVAEAICAVYPSPARLIEAYRNCTSDEGMNLLKDISIRRMAGPLTAVRKVGPELSKKVYTMFTSQNGDALLGSGE